MATDSARLATTPATVAPAPARAKCARLSASSPSAPRGAGQRDSATLTSHGTSATPPASSNAIDA